MPQPVQYRSCVCAAKFGVPQLGQNFWPAASLAWQLGHCTNGVRLRKSTFLVCSSARVLAWIYSLMVRVYCARNPSYSSGIQPSQGPAPEFQHTSGYT